ncbi:hypothetical protein PAF17_10445 [Paracoccus sp. Z330]|uniref:Helix-turn-helix domain-containing protein n=1 Tax=Paracoccus onchidii TaxID=3017813 RepID=A0ABT4ZF98_9RHOB|nr:hypothetical protein [Paracoccus onchidii]MDB6177919.1 hypothetical protein [Paracoccus onchidii]
MLNPKTTTQRDRCARQMSHANLLDGRGRGHRHIRRAHVHAHRPDRAVFLQRWSLLMIASFDSREACAVHFGVTFQTACNWFDGLNAPYGHHVDFAHASLSGFSKVMREEKT